MINLLFLCAFHILELTPLSKNVTKHALIGCIFDMR